METNLISSCNAIARHLRHIHRQLFWSFAKKVLMSMGPLVPILTCAMVLPSVASAQGSINAPCSGCEIVHFSGGVAENGNDCRVTMPVPCVLELYASVGLNSAITPECASLFVIHSGGDVNWTIKKANGGSGNGGLNIESLGSTVAGIYGARIWTQKSQVTPGGYVVIAKDSEGNERKGSITVTVDGCGDPDKNCEP